MSVYFLPLLILTLLLGIGWALRRRPSALLWRGAEYRSVLDSLEDAILVYDADGRPVYLNRAAREWFELEEAERYETQPLRLQVSPIDDYFALLSDGGRASLKIGSRFVEAVAQRVVVQGVEQITIVLHDVTAAHTLLAEERRRVRELGLLNEINQAINASLNLDELVNTILAQLQRLFSFQSAFISLWDPKTEQLIVEGSTGMGVRAGQVVTEGFRQTQHLVDERQPLLIGDTTEYLDQMHDPRARSYLGFPLLAGSSLIGTLELFADRVDAFSYENLDVLQVVASHVAVAIENARLYGESIVRSEQLATMNTLSSAINASLNLDDLLEIVVYSISQVIGCDRAAVYLLDQESRLLSLAKSQGLSRQFVRDSQNIKPELGGRAQVVLERYPLIVNEIEIEGTNRMQPSVAYLEQEGIRSFADFPLRGREHVLGALAVYYDQPHRFDESELELLKTFANQVTLALENARLYERTDRALARRVDQLAAIEEIGRELTSTLDLTGVFNLVLQRAMGNTGASAGLLAIYKPDVDHLELIAHRGYPTGTLDRYVKEGWPADHGHVGLSARTGETALINDVRADPNYIPRLRDTQAQLVVPMLKEGRVLGVISLESGRQHGFSSEDVRFTTQLAELAVIAIDNARLFAQVREGRDNLQAILDSTRDGILVIGRDNRIVMANPMIEEMSGLSAQDLVGLRVSELVERADPRVATMLGYPVQQLDRALKVLDVRSDTVKKRTYEMAGGVSRHIEQVASAVKDRDGAVVGRLIVFRDVTEERRLMAMRQDLTDMIIHDLRSPLTAVVGGVQVASDLTAASGDPTAVRRALDMANEACNRLMSLVDSLLDISRLEAGQMPLDKQPNLLPLLVTSTVQQMKPIAKREMVALEVQTVSDVPPVNVDAELIGRVLVNLIDNAVKHSPRNSTVVIKVMPERAGDGHGPPDLPAEPVVASDAAVQSVRCVVLDTGPGIPQEYRHRVFERFAQLDGRRRGKGLGLAFCRLAIQAHGGRIWVEDNPEGQGSAFVFSLTAVPPELLATGNPDHIERRI
jgi:PAS domain S-box-containing protein